MTERHKELLWAGACTLLAAAISVIAKPLPPLLDAVKDRTWTRGIEFALLTVAFWVPLAVIGILRVKLAIGPGGVTAERVEIEERTRSATRDTLEAVEDLGAHVKQLATIVTLLNEQHHELKTRVEAMSRPAPPTLEPIPALPEDANA